MRAPTSSPMLEQFGCIARLIADDKAPKWLPRLLHSRICDLRQTLALERERPTRRQMRRKLRGLRAAAARMIEEFSSPWIPEFLGADLSEPREGGALVQLFENLVYAVDLVGASRALTTEAGFTKAGSGRARSAASLSARTYCAMIIVDTWKFIHGADPLPNSRRAAEAAEAYWRAAGGDPRATGEEPLASWRYHIRLAIEIKTRTMTAEYRRHLVENDRSWKLLHGLLEEAA